MLRGRQKKNMDSCTHRAPLGPFVSSPFAGGSDFAAGLSLTFAPWKSVGHGKIRGGDLFLLVFLKVAATMQIYTYVT